MSLNIGQGNLISLALPAKTIYIANPDVAEVSTPTANKIFISGKSAGTTTLYALGISGDLILQKEIRVGYDVDSLRRLLAQRFPAQNIQIESAPGSVMVSGRVASPHLAEAVLATIERYMGSAGEIINRLETATPSQVNLRVRIAEVSKNVGEKFGINWQSVLNASDFNISLFTGRNFVNADGGWDGSTNGFGSVVGQYNSSNGRINLTGLLDALESENLVRVLAEPNLTAISGESAEFVAGGEVPLQTVGENGTSNVTFKQYGVSLKFIPEVLSRDRIRISLAPEVSQLTNTSTLEGLPSLEVRRLSTTVELSNGQSFVIGGLLQNNISNTVDRLPVLGALPILGKLFSSSEYATRQSELVVVVTPQIIESAQGDGSVVANSSLRPLNGMEFIFANRMNGRPAGSYASGIYLPNAIRYQGGAGFVY